MRVICNTCQGEYDPIGRDGMRYFHACAPDVDPIDQTSTERADRRDDNLTRDRRAREATPVAEGRGVTRAPARPAAEGR